MTLTATILCGFFLVWNGMVVLSSLLSSQPGEGMAVLLLVGHTVPFAFALFALHSSVKVWKVWVTVAFFVPFVGIGLWNVVKLSVHPAYSSGLLWSSITTALPVFIVAAVFVRSRRQGGLVNAGPTESEQGSNDAKAQRP
jgi:hypothetical protein